VEPSDFLKTAELLKNETDEPHLRTSVGRSYYAAFLYFREWLESKGLKKKRKPKLSAHFFVIQCLESSGVRAGTRAARYLRDLRQWRTDADYHLEKVITENDAEDALAKARKTIADFTADIDPQKERDLLRNAREYAQEQKWV